MPKKVHVALFGARSAQEIPQDIITRSLSLRLDAGGSPASIDDKTRSVEVICSTEAPVDIFDWERWEIVPEVLLMSGCQIPATRQIPLLNTHYRGDVSSVLGSCRELVVEGGQLIGRAHYSEADAAADTVWKKTREGHLTDYSIGYRVLESYYIPDREKSVIDGRTFEGPVKVATQWKVRELSTCPIGADEFAKARAATPPQERTKTPAKEIETMDAQTRKFLESRGLAKDATDAEALRFLETLDVRTEDDGSAADAARAEGVRTEQARIVEVRSLCERAKLPADKIDGFITEGKSVEEVRAAAFDHMTQKTVETTKDVNFRNEVIVDERDKFRAAGQDALIVRGGLRHDVAKLAPGALDLRGYSMVELARESLRMAGQSYGGDAMQMVGRALTTSDFPILLGNTANLSLMQGWDTAEESWEKWADGSGNVPNFLTHTMARAGETDDLDEIGEDDEYKYGSNNEQSESYRVATFGKLNRISRQAIINDDLGAITDAFMKRGEAASRKIGDIVYAVLTANSAMGDGTALFHANHGNLGTAGAIGEVTMAEAVKKLGLMKDLNGKRRLNIPVQHIVAPRSIEGAAEIFFNSMQFTGANSASTRANPYAGTKYARIYDARLDDDSATAWYFLGPKGKTVKVFFLNGNRTPYLETKEGWSSDGIEFKTRIDAGAKAVDYRGMGKNAGA